MSLKDNLIVWRKYNTFFLFSIFRFDNFDCAPCEYMHAMRVYLVLVGLVFFATFHCLQTNQSHRVRLCEFFSSYLFRCWVCEK